MSSQVPHRVSALVFTPVDTSIVPIPGGSEVVLAADSSSGKLEAIFSDGTTFELNKGNLSATALTLSGTSSITGGTALSLKIGSATVVTITDATLTIGAAEATFTLTQADAPVDTAGAVLTIQSQKGGAKSKTADGAGGNIVIATGVGGGSADAGTFALKIGATSVLTANKTGLAAPKLNAAGVVHTDSSGVFSTSTIVDADVSASAAIAGTKVTPILTTQSITNTTAALTDGVGIVFVDNSSSTTTINLPAPASNNGRIVEIFIGTSPATHNVVLHRAGSEKIDGSAADKTCSDATTRGICLSCNGTDWFTVAGNLAA